MSEAKRESTSAPSYLELVAKRTYNVSSRIYENYPESRFFVSAKAHRLWHLLQTLYPDLAGKEEIAIDTCPKGFIVLDKAVTKQFNRDLAKHINYWHTATQEEITAAKIKGGKKKTHRYTVDDYGVVKIERK